MLMDKQNSFSENQTLVVGTGTTVSTNIIDLGAAGTDTLGNTPLQDIFRGNPPKVFCQMTTAATSGGSATIDFRIIQSAAENLSSPDILDSTGALAVATLTAGYRPKLALKPGQVTKRYLAIHYVVATASVTAGAVTAGLVADEQTNQTGI